MARPEIQGLKYFPFDVGFFTDKKIRLLRVGNGADGVEIYLRLICKCYEDNGYYLNWDSAEDYSLMAEETGFSIEKVRLTVSSCLKRSLFDSKLFKVSNVLTSRGIQRRYFEAIRATKEKAAAAGRHTFIRTDVNLLTNDDFFELNKNKVWLKVGENLSFSENNPSKSENNPDKSTINPPKEKERKEKEIKGEERKEKAPPSVCEKYLQKIGDMEDEDHDKINNWLLHVDESLIIYAIEEAAKYEKKNWDYINGIIKNHFDNGRTSKPTVKTKKSFNNFEEDAEMDDFEREQMEKRLKKRGEQFERQEIPKMDE